MMAPHLYGYGESALVAIDGRWQNVTNGKYSPIGACLWPWGHCASQAVGQGVGFDDRLGGGGGPSKR